MKIKETRRERVIKKVLDYLNHFGESRFYDYDFNVKEATVYAGIEIIMDQRIAEGLEKAINNEINPPQLESKLVPARIRFIGISEQKNSKVRYTADIVPEPDHFCLPPDYKIPEDSTPEKELMKLKTDMFLEKLPSALKNLRQRKICLLEENN